MPESSKVPRVIGGIADMGSEELPGVGNHLAGRPVVAIHGSVRGTAEQGDQPKVDGRPGKSQSV